MCARARKEECKGVCVSFYLTINSHDFKKNVSDLRASESVCVRVCTRERRNVSVSMRHFVLLSES